MEKIVWPWLLMCLCIFLSATGIFAGPRFPLTATDAHLVRQGQQVVTRVELSADGVLHATMVLENGSKLWGLCAVSYFAVKDRQGKILEAHAIPESCVGKPQQDVIRKIVEWNGTVKNPDTLSGAATIQIRSFPSPLGEPGQETKSPEDIFQ
jgi:hypothetical protein